MALFLLWLFFLFHSVSSHLIEILASQKECFFEDLHVNDQMTVTYQVGGGGHLDIDFWINDPTGSAIKKNIRYSTGTSSITATANGRYEYCFSNQMSTIADKIVRCVFTSSQRQSHSRLLKPRLSTSFNVHGVVYVGDEAAEVVAPIEREIRSLAHGLTSVKDEQEYIVIRERTHRNTAESTNSRVKWWSILQAVVLFSVVAWQVYYLKSFFEVKRVI
ncbi:emp24/gp25L/p24 family/GOLD-domain-containing protein [Russula earlei]|uniref:Emp24/gp25L/p24 family/GOLD-domain-containing protein n=1 Tax=Russula earlei TaxID=71964 RepID=A0ACC0UAK9_9AGAM|nr:emp24/gp25L/p24 family/GOLD-domain-containing protein [Russula earlei]